MAKLEELKAAWDAAAAAWSDADAAYDAAYEAAEDAWDTYEAELKKTKEKQDG